MILSPDRDHDVSCVITRFHLRRRRFLLPTYLEYRRLLKLSAQTRPPGLLQSAFLIENATTCYSLSLWKGRPLFSAAVPHHVEVARRVFGRLRIDESRGPELWSTTWALAGTSNNLHWEGLDLRHLSADEDPTHAA